MTKNRWQAERLPYKSEVERVVLNALLFMAAKPLNFIIGLRTSRSTFNRSKPVRRRERREEAGPRVRPRPGVAVFRAAFFRPKSVSRLAAD